MFSSLYFIYFYTMHFFFFLVGRLKR